VNIYVLGTSGMALDLYATQQDAFKQSRHVAELFCSQAAIAIGFSDTAAVADTHCSAEDSSVKRSES
jgi:hypothetical protein